MQYSASSYATSALSMIYALHDRKSRCLWRVMVGERANGGVLPSASYRSARPFPSHCLLLSCCWLAYSYCIVRSRCQFPFQNGCFPLRSPVVLYALVPLL